MSTERPPGAGAHQAPVSVPPVDVLGWELGEAVDLLTSEGRRVRLVPAGSPVAAAAPRWRVARAAVGSDGELVLTVVPEAPDRVHAEPAAAVGESRD